MKCLPDDQLTEPNEVPLALAVTVRRYVGLTNLGNSCYMNSVLQMVWSLDLLHRRYGSAAPAIFKSSPPDTASDFPTQVCESAGRLSGPHPPLSRCSLR